MISEIAGFDWDAGNWPKCGKHGVSKREVEDVLTSDPLIMPDRKSEQEQRFNAVGQSLEGRYLFVVFTVRTRNTTALFRPISARFMHAKEVRNYERQKRT